jgi:polysaccharide pyruvyl transferase WcaK-like protein
MCGAMNILADKAIDAGMKVSVEAVGIETAPADCYPLISALFSKCDRITVRSSESRRIAKEIGFLASVVQDFAYAISPDIDAAKNIMPLYDDSLPVIGIAAGENRTIADPLYVALELLDEFNVLYLPHTAFRSKSQKVPTGKSIGQSLLDHNKLLAKRYKYLAYPDSPQQLLGIYRLLDGVVGYRYHSYIFAEIAETPLYPRNGLSTSKARGYFEDHPDMLRGINGTPDKNGALAAYFRSQI